MRKRELKNTVKLFIYICLVLILTGCYKNKVDIREGVDSQERKEIVVFCEKGSGTIVVNNFISEYPDIPIKVINYASNNIEQMISQNGEPDLIISNGGVDIREWVEKKYIGDMTFLYESDVNFDSTMYFPEVESVGKIQGQLFAWPLGLEMHYMTIREEEWLQSSFADMSGDYTVQDILDALEKELDKKRDFPCWVVSTGWYDTFLDWAWDSGAIYIEDNELEFNMELLDQIYRVWKKENINYFEIRENRRNHMDALDPREEYGEYLLSSWNHGLSIIPQIGLVYAQSANQELLEQDTYVIWRPMQQNQTEYAAQVSVWGMIGDRSEYKQEAYDILRKMMDLSMKEWTPPMMAEEGNYYINTPCPVNLDRALALIQVVENSGVNNFSIGQTMKEKVIVSKQFLNTSLKEEMEKYLKHITKLYYIPDSADREIEQGLRSYIWADEIEFIDVADIFLKICKEAY